jgi:hypothetical protein
MLPRDEVYGAWPLSGEIDMVESRGNGLRYTAQYAYIFISFPPRLLIYIYVTSGSNYVQGSLNWGPAPNLNGVSKSYSWWTERRRGFNQDFRTYALEWTEDFLYVRFSLRFSDFFSSLIIIKS